jgi:Domain of unknown function (DUF4349)
MGRHITHTDRAARPPDRQLRRSRITATAAALTLTLARAACGGDDDESGLAVAPEPAAAETAEAAGDGALAVGEGAPATALSGQPAIDPTIELGAIGRDVIVEMYVVMSSPDLPRSVAQITGRAASLGGGIASSTVDYGDPAVVNPPNASAILVVKVPPDAVDSLIDGLADAGTVRSLEQSAQDVTDQLVDLEVRIANARQSVENVRVFMERTQNLTELVTLEAELTRRQTELEQLEAQQRTLTDRVALATITIEVRPEAALPVPDGRGGISGAFADGWEAFVTVVRGGVMVVAVLAPFLVAGGLLALALWFAGRRWSAASRRDRETRATRAAAPEPGTVNERDDVPTPTG